MLGAMVRCRIARLKTMERKGSVDGPGLPDRGSRHVLGLYPGFWLIPVACSLMIVCWFGITRRQRTKILWKLGPSGASSLFPGCAGGEPGVRPKIEGKLQLRRGWNQHDVHLRRLRSAEVMVSSRGQQ